MRYSVIVPAYNEEEVIGEAYRRLTAVMSGFGESYEIIFVNDGSKDRTAELIAEICEADKNVKVINFSRNFGHQLAITAGIDYAGGEAVIVTDADMQDPPEVIPLMVEKWKAGYEVVYGKRIKRQGEGLFKKVSAALFYKTIRAFTDFDIPVNVGDFRLLDRKVCSAMKKIREQNRYVRGLVNWVGFKQTAVEYMREKRFAGSTKYPLRKMLRFAADGIISFSYKPLKLATYVGFFLSAFSFMYMIWVFIQRLIFNNVGIGWASLVSVSLFFNGVILIILGIVGEYIGRIYDEVKMRPLYIVRELMNFEDEKD